MLPIIRSGLVLELHFNELTGSTVYDLSGYNNHGTIYGATRVQEGFGRALWFDGVDDYISIPSSPSLDTTEAITIEAWVRLNPGGPDVAYDIIRRAGGYEFYVGRDDGKIRLALQSGTSWYVYASISPIARDGKTWYHIAATWDKTTGKVKLYINGSLDVTRDGITTSLSTAGTLYVGGFGVNYSTYGIIDELLIYNRALSESEIKAIYNYYMKKRTIER